MPRFAANLSMMFTEHAFLDRFQAAADADFKAVEYLLPYDYPADEIRRRLEAAGLEQALFNMPAGNWDAGDRGLAALADRRDEFRASVVKAVDYAKIIGNKLVHMMAGMADANDPQAIATYRESMKYAADHAGEAGLTVLIEPINGRDMPGYFLNDFNQALAFVKQADRADLRLQFDIYHRQIVHGDVIMGLREMMPWTAHVQTASVPLRNEPGTGELNDAAIFAELESLGYAGFVGCEYRPRGETVAGLGWMKA